MVLERHPGLLKVLLDPLTKAFRTVHPNVITVASFPFAVLAAALLFASDPAREADQYYLFWAAVAISSMGLLDLLDGRIARLMGKSSRYGDFLDHVMDRYIDVVLIVGIAFSPWADLRVGLFAVIGTLLTSYMGTQAQAVGAGRLYAGVLTRADRIVLLIAAPLADHLLTRTGIAIPLTWPGTDHALGLLLWYFAVMGIITSLQRFVVVGRALRRVPP